MQEILFTGKDRVLKFSVCWHTLGTALSYRGHNLLVEVTVGRDTDDSRAVWLTLGTALPFRCDYLLVGTAIGRDADDSRAI